MHSLHNFAQLRIQSRFYPDSNLARGMLWNGENLWQRSLLEIRLKRLLYSTKTIHHHHHHHHHHQAVTRSCSVSNLKKKKLNKMLRKTPLRSAILLKRDFNRDVSLWILRIGISIPFLKITSAGCFWKILIETNGHTEKQRNYCAKLLKKSKKKSCNNSNVEKIK